MCKKLPIIGILQSWTQLLIPIQLPAARQWTAVWHWLPGYQHDPNGSIPFCTINIAQIRVIYGRRKCVVTETIFANGILLEHFSCLLSQKTDHRSDRIFVQIGLATVVNCHSIIIANWRTKQCSGFFLYSNNLVRGSSSTWQHLLIMRVAESFPAPQSVRCCRCWKQLKILSMNSCKAKKYDKVDETPPPLVLSDVSYVENIKYPPMDRSYSPSDNGMALVFLRCYRFFHVSCSNPVGL